MTGFKTLFRSDTFANFDFISKGVFEYTKTNS